jgi:hypothetical protein
MNEAGENSGFIYGGGGIVKLNNVDVECFSVWTAAVARHISNL